VVVFGIDHNREDGHRSSGAQYASHRIGKEKAT